MALVLKRIIHPNDCLRCDITRKILSYGDEYYEDTEDGTIIDFNFYHDTKWARKKEEGIANYEKQMGQLDYRMSMFQRQRDFLRETMLDRHQLSDDCSKWDVNTYNLNINGDMTIENNLTYESVPTKSQSESGDKK